VTDSEVLLFLKWWKHWRQRADERLSYPGNQEPLVVKDKDGRPCL